jgi:hypothetical protein
MRVRRDISSIPFRSATETWDSIVALVVSSGSRDIEKLKAAGDTIASIITDEIPAEHPFIMEGSGPQLRIYCRYRAAAIQEPDETDTLTWNPTAGDWTLHVPCDAENLQWVERALAKVSPRIKAFDVAKGDRAEEADVPSAHDEVVVDWTVKD